MATAAIGTKRTFSAMNADSVGGDGWAPDLNATTFENRTGQRVGVDGSCKFNRCLFYCLEHIKLAS